MAKNNKAAGGGGEIWRSNTPPLSRHTQISAVSLCLNYMRETIVAHLLEVLQSHAGKKLRLEETIMFLQ